MEFRQKYYEKKHADETNDLSKYEYRLINALITAKIDNIHERNILERLDDYIEHHNIANLLIHLVLFILGIILGALLFIEL